MIFLRQATRLPAAVHFDAAARFPQAVVMNILFCFETEKAVG